MSSEHVEVLRDLSEVCRAAIKAGDWKVDGACDPDAALRRADAAIASLPAPQPPAEAQAQGGGAITCPECHGTGGHYWHEADGSERGERCATCYGFGYYTAPPSTPVGVEGLVVKWKKESESLDIHPAGLAARRVCAIELEHALSQQPAAVDGAGAKDAEIEALRVRADAMAGEAIKHEARAERLAEAINAYKAECDNPAKDYVLRAKRRDEMFALLRDHDHEGGNP